MGNWLSQRASGFHSVGLGREFHGLQLDNPQKVDWIYHLLTTLGQALGLPAVHVYVQGGASIQAGCELMIT